MSDAPNNFPSEGQHNTITRESLDTLEANRSSYVSHLNYTIGGTTESQVHSVLEEQRKFALDVGNQRFYELSYKVQSDYVFAASKGQAKALFEASSNPSKTYAELQREAVIKSQDRKQDHLL